MKATPKFELHGLQKLFATAVTAINDPSRLLFNADILREYVVGEVARVKERLLQNFVTIEGDDAARRYVRMHQFAVVKIIDKLFQQIEQPGSMECCTELEGLLSFIREQFPQYFDELAKAPLMYNTDVHMEIAMSLNSLRRELMTTSKCKMTPVMVLDPLERFYGKPPGHTVSFWRLRYLRYIMAHAATVVRNPELTGDPDDHLVNLMLYLNYNSRKTFLEFTEFICYRVPKDLDRETRVGRLSHFLKIATQAMVKPNTGYHPHGPTFKTLMIDHLTAELKSVENDVAPAPVVSEREVTAWPRVKLNLSVAQLGCILRLVTESGLVTADNISLLMRSLSLHCATKRSDRISFDSLRNRFYEIESGTQQSVEKILAQLLELCERISSPDSQDADA